MSRVMSRFAATIGHTVDSGDWERVRGVSRRRANALPVSAESSPVRPITAGQAGEIAILVPTATFAPSPDLASARTLSPGAVTCRSRIPRCDELSGWEYETYSRGCKRRLSRSAGPEKNEQYWSKGGNEDVDAY
jgi:hypothetical protein